MPAYWGRGYATEIVTALCRWHFEHPDPDYRPELRAYVFQNNRASTRVLEKAGFRQVDVTGEDKPGELIYQLTDPPFG